jgi:hypothetical protein
MCEASHGRDDVLQAYKSLVEIQTAGTRDDGNNSQRFTADFRRSKREWFWHTRCIWRPERRQAMPDNTGARDRRDTQRIDVHDEQECRYWSTRFGVSPERLRQAVREAGPAVQAVREYLGK